MSMLRKQYRFVSFQMMVRVDTITNPDGSIEVGWVGASFGVLIKNGGFYGANYRISLTQGWVEERIRGSDVSHSTYDVFAIKIFVFQSRLA